MEIKDLVLQKPRFNALVQKLRGFEASKLSVIQLKGLTGSAAATFLAPLKNAVDRIVVFILNDEEKAGYFYHDLCQIGGEDAVSFFPSGYKRSRSRPSRPSSSATTTLRPKVPRPMPFWW